MSAQFRTRPAVVRSPAAPSVRRPDRLRRQLLVERLFFIALVVLLAVIGVRQARALRAYQIAVNGQPVATVGDKATADRLLSRLTADSPDARFRQEVAVRQISPRAMVIVPEKVASAALARAVSVVAPAHVVLINGRVAAALESKEEAEQALARARAQAVGTPAGTALARVARIESVEFDRSRIVTRDEAIRALVAAAGAGVKRQARRPSVRQATPSPRPRA